MDATPLTPLDGYMTKHSIKDAEFAPRIKRDRSIVSKIRKGTLKPTLDVAAEIERETNGEIPMQAWVDGLETPTQSSEAA